MNTVCICYGTTDLGMSELLGCCWIFNPLSNTVCLGMIYSSYYQLNGKQFRNWNSCKSVAVPTWSSIVCEAGSKPECGLPQIHNVGSSSVLPSTSQEARSALDGSMNLVMVTSSLLTASIRVEHKTERMHRCLHIPCSTRRRGLHVQNAFSGVVANPSV